MKCPYCSFFDTSVLDSRETEDLESIRRRRECLKCGKRFTTYERIEMVNLIVIKKDGRREQFDRKKLVNGFLKATEKRPISIDSIEKVVSEIESELRSKDGIEIPSVEIGEIVMTKLKALDKVAYIRFASVYRSFGDLETFEKEVRNLLRSGKPASKSESEGFRSQRTTLKDKTKVSHIN